MGAFRLDHVLPIRFDLLPTYLEYTFIRSPGIDIKPGPIQRGPASLPEIGQENLTCPDSLRSGWSRIRLSHPAGQSECSYAAALSATIEC